MRVILMISTSMVALMCMMSATADQRATQIWAETATNEELVDALADDDVRRNAGFAMRELRVRGDDAIAELETALKSNDRQQRQLAASLLRRIESYEPSDTMLFVCVEGLANDRLPASRGRYRSVYGPNATQGTPYLIRYIDRAEGFVAAGMNYNDMQQRFFCAYILGMTSHVGYARKICEILTPHLNDNSIRGDAVLATRALYLTGRGVIPHLNKASRKADEQGRSLIDLVILDLYDPPVLRKDLYERGAMTDVTCLVHDPAYEDVRIGSMIPFVGTYARE